MVFLSSLRCVRDLGRVSCVLALSLTIVGVTSCQTLSSLNPFSSDESDKPNEEQVEVAKKVEKQAMTGGVEHYANGEQIELKQAKIWERMEELEDELRIQREKIKLLEQGLLTGIAPEKLGSYVREFNRNDRRTYLAVANINVQMQIRNRSVRSLFDTEINIQYAQKSR